MASGIVGCASRSAQRSTSRWRVAAVEHHAITPFAHQFEASRYCRRSARERAAGAVEVVLDRRGVAHAMNANPSGGAIGTRSPTWTREPNGCGGPVTASITMSSPTRRTGEAPESEVLGETFHLRQRVVDDAVAALRGRAERDERGTERVRAGAGMPTQQTAVSRARPRPSARSRSSGRPGARCRRATTTSRGPSPARLGARPPRAARCSTSVPPYADPPPGG